MKLYGVLLGILIGLMLAFPGVANAHALGFESDVSEDGVINYCNPNGVFPAYVNESTADWNAVAGANGPRFRNVTNVAGAFCELSFRRDVGTVNSPFLARVQFNLHPDQVQFSRAFQPDLSPSQEQGTSTHEDGHVIGFDHPNPESRTLCNISVLSTTRFCVSINETRTVNPGTHDVNDVTNYWINTPIYPIANKCWTPEDADGDGVCDRFGPPGGATARSAPVPVPNDIED